MADPALAIAVETTQVRARDPVRVAAAAGLFAAAAVFVLFVLRPLPSGMLNLLGAPVEGVQRSGGLRLWWIPTATHDLDVIEQRFIERGMFAKLRPDRGAILVEVPGIAEAEVQPMVRILGDVTHARLHEVVLGWDMQDVVELAARPAVSAEVEQWTDSNSSTFTFWYARASTREALVEAVAAAHRRGWQPRDGAKVGYERIASPGDPAAWRAYLVREPSLLAADEIGIAEVSTRLVSEPVVVLVLERTARLPTISERGGRKLAVVIGDEIRWTPILHTLPTIGLAVLHFDELHRLPKDDPNALAVALRSAILRGGATVGASYVPATDLTSTIWLGRALIAIGGGGSIAAATWLFMLVWCSQAPRVIRRSRARLRLRR